MKILIKIVFVTGILLMTCTCSDKNGENQTCTSILGLCRDNAFKQTYLSNFLNEDIIIIKGIAFDVREHGRNIKVIEDLKGNLGEKTSIFVWGAGGCDFSTCVASYGRQEIFAQYEKTDTLIMILKKIDKVCCGIEKPGDFATLTCQHSVLNFSNGNVTGKINIFEQKSTAKWDELQKEWDDFLKSSEKPSWWIKNFMPEPFIIAYNALINFDDCIFIKGLVLDTKHKYGKEIMIISDLKGNFLKEENTFIALGDPDPNRLYSEQFDDLTLYDNRDTLLMLLIPVPDFIKNINDFNEPLEYYETMPYSFSVLKLSNDYVSGYITSCYGIEERMSLEEFQKLLETINDTK